MTVAMRSIGSSRSLLWPYDGAAALTLLLLVIVAIVVGTVAPQQHSERFSGVADHLEYLVVVALLPALAWAVGLYAAVGNR